MEENQETEHLSIVKIWVGEVKMKYKCTFCKTIFDTMEEGYKHFEKVKHSWGGLEQIHEECDEHFSFGKESVFDYELRIPFFKKEINEFKDRRRWLEMVSYHKLAQENFPNNPADQWYYFYCVGIKQGKSEIVRLEELKKFIKIKKKNKR